MCWWYWAPGISSILYIFCWLSWEVSGFLSFMDCWANPFDRALLATIRDKGLCPCPRCLVPKSKLDQTGTKRDSKFRLQNDRTYLFDRVLIARNAIYNSAAAIAGAAVNRLLKATSSVPTLVSQIPWYLFVIWALCFILRMHLLINLAAILTFHACSLLIFCTSLSWVSGKHFSPT